MGGSVKVAEAGGKLLFLFNEGDRAKGGGSNAPWRVSGQLKNYTASNYQWLEGQWDKQGPLFLSVDEEKVVGKKFTTLTTNTPALFALLFDSSIDLVASASPTSINIL